MHAGVNERLKKEEDVPRSAAAQRRRHIDVTLIVHFELTPHGRQNLTRHVPLSLRHVRRRRPHAHALPNLRGGVRHHADNPVVAG